MQTFWNTKYTKRNYECTNIVAIKAEQLPKGYDTTIWKANGLDVRTGIELQYLGAIYQNGERFEQYGYL